MANLWPIVERIREAAMIEESTLRGKLKAGEITKTRFDAELAKLERQLRASLATVR